MEKRILIVGTNQEWGEKVERKLLDGIDPRNKRFRVDLFLSFIDAINEKKDGVVAFVFGPHLETDKPFIDALKIQTPTAKIFKDDIVLNPASQIQYVSDIPNNLFVERIANCVFRGGP